jgi:hypothetical protein
VDLALDGAAQERVPGRIELHLVDSIPEAVVGPEDRDVALGAPAVLERLDAAGERAGLARAVDPPAAALALEALAQGEVDLEQVEWLERRALVQDRTGGVQDLSVNRDSHSLAEASRPAAHPAEAAPLPSFGRVRGPLSFFGRVRGPLGELGLAPTGFLAPAVLFLTRPRAILGQPDLVEHQARGEHQPERHEHERQVLS